jgi:hypothetical protein
MVRKTTDEEDKRKQEEMVEATLRKLNWRINTPRFGEYNQYENFLLACRQDVIGSRGGAR